MDNKDFISRISLLEKLRDYLAFTVCTAEAKEATIEAITLAREAPAANPWAALRHRAHGNDLPKPGVMVLCETPYGTFRPGCVDERGRWWGWSKFLRISVAYWYPYPESLEEEHADG